MKSITIPTAAGTIAAYVRGADRADAPTLVMAHGWPDNHEVWDLVAARLGDAFKVVTFDGRGVGGSSPVAGRNAYSLSHLADDIDAVVAAVSPDRPVHLVGHDWGSVAGWEYIVRAGVGARVASFTSVSGPNLDYLGATLRHRSRRSGRSIRPALAQAAKSAYTVVLSTPVVRTLMWRAGFGRLFRLWLRVTEGIAPDSGYPGDTLAADAIASVPLYRTNIWPRLRNPDPRPTRIPVHVIVATGDNYVNPALAADVSDWVDDLTVSHIAAGHWSPRSHPDDVATRISTYIRSIVDPSQEAAPA